MLELLLLFTSFTYLYLLPTYLFFLLTSPSHISLFLFFALPFLFTYLLFLLSFPFSLHLLYSRSPRLPIYLSFPHPFYNLPFLSTFFNFSFTLPCLPTHLLFPLTSFSPTFSSFLPFFTYLFFSHTFSNLPFFQLFSTFPFIHLTNSSN